MPKHVPQLIIIVLLTVGIYLATSTPGLRLFALQMTLVSFVALGIYSYVQKRKHSDPTQHKVFFYLLAGSTLFLVAATGWFFSPFFFLLYFLAIVLCFIFSRSVSIAFVITLVCLFSFNIGEVDLAYDFLVILSLLTVIPLSLYLRKKYLHLQEAAKEILILKEKKEAYKSSIEEVLANRVSRLSLSLLQPINDTKQLAYHLRQVKDEKQRQKDQERIIASSDEALRILKTFEEEVTGKKLH
jgi:hypothetical protein